MNIDPSVHEYLQRVMKPGENLKVTITSGGCDGFMYNFKAAVFNPDTDIAYDIWVITDRKSALFLKDCALEYKQGLSGSYLTINNPRAISLCGCGASFAIKKD